MNYIFDLASLQRLIALDIDPRLSLLLAARREIVAAGHTEYLIIQPGDMEADVVRHVGFSPLVNPLDGARYPDAAFHPHWDWLADLGGWFELIQTFGSSFAYVLLIQNAHGTEPEFLNMCRQHATNYP
ncbi:hypothetical protein [Sphingomonas oligophenolica]|uniref:Uncharacterized protein n=1 Tax=Sphingomonas oligophenolica TaxID=301154 RepID=A0A502CJU8_9SPHN|nr:hypothetical protein [Sphingomonas oligophenolica]TPG13198.1 hypothetical protein EAH84_07310 [Sphingomonas oligophenolica]